MSLRKSQLEIFVETYLKSLKSHLVRRSDRKYIQKAINMIIAITAGSPCCLVGTSSIDLFTPYDNKLTNTVRVLINELDRRKWKQSIARTIKLLENSIFINCCLNPSDLFYIMPVVNDCNILGALVVDGVTIPPGIGNEAHTPQDFVDLMNAAYTGYATFTLVNEGLVKVQLATKHTSLTFDFTIQCR